MLNNWLWLGMLWLVVIALILLVRLFKSKPLTILPAITLGIVTYTTMYYIVNSIDMNNFSILEQVLYHYVLPIVFAVATTLLYFICEIVGWKVIFHKREDT